MKVSLLGVGKTGSQVLALLEEKGYPARVFNRSHPPTVEELQKTDVGIAFVPSDALGELMPLLLESRRPLICGTTGMEWPADLDQRLREHNVPWIWGSNFAAGMVLIRRMLGILGKAPQLFSDYSVTIEEVHHKKKKDAPSGTALKWREWSKLSPKITSRRKGDVVGRHRLTLKSSEGEKIVLTHKALSRKLFASGALWAAEQLHSSPPPGGLHLFETFAQEKLFES